jgi:ketosteroid isomerase-like protein
MKPLAFITAVALATVTFIGAQQIRAASVSADTAAAKKEILRLEEQRNQAILSGDAGALERMTSDDYTFITLRGELRTKSEIVEGFKSGSFHYDSRQISELSVRLYGDTAVVTGRSIQNGKENSKDYSGDYRFTRVYVRQHGRWLTVALQATLIGPGSANAKD